MWEKLTPYRHSPLFDMDSMAHFDLCIHTGVGHWQLCVIYTRMGSEAIEGLLGTDWLLHNGV